MMVRLILMACLTAGRHRPSHPMNAVQDPAHVCERHMQNPLQPMHQLAILVHFLHPNRQPLVTMFLCATLVPVLPLFL